jgi:hypothetical protein
METIMSMRSESKKLDFSELEQAVLRELQRQGVKFAEIGVRDFGFPETHIVFSSLTEDMVHPKYVERARISNKLKAIVDKTVGDDAPDPLIHEPTDSMVLDTARRWLIKEILPTLTVEDVLRAIEGFSAAQVEEFANVVPDSVTDRIFALANPVELVMVDPLDLIDEANTNAIAAALQ